MGVELCENWGENWMLARVVRNSGNSRTDAPPSGMGLAARRQCKESGYVWLREN